MVILLNILKWLGILLLIVLALVLVILLLVLLVPFRYRAAAKVDDPDRHSEFPLAVFKERSDVMAEVSWLLGALKVLVSYPHGDLLCVKIFGKDIGIMERLSKKESEEEAEEEEKEEEEEESSVSEKVEKALDKVGRTFDLVDYLYRVLTGSCGRRAFAKVKRRLCNILLHVIPSQWKLCGTVGLSDPCLNGRMSGTCAMLMPVCDGHLQMQTEWEEYRCDLDAELSGRLRLAVPVKEAIPLVFDKDCRKVLKKLKKAKSKFAAKEPEKESDQTEVQIK